MKVGNIMSHIIVIYPNNYICLCDYKDYHSINEVIDGCFECCGVFGALDSMCITYCNEEFLFREDLNFNGLASIICGQPIYGNLVIMKDEHNSYGERDSSPFDLIQATGICMVLEKIKEKFMPIIKELHSQYDNKRPEPKAHVTITPQEENNLESINDYAGEVETN